MTSPAPKHMPPSGSPLAFARASQLVQITCLLGIALGVGSAAVQICHYEEPADVISRILAAELFRGLLMGAVAMIVWLLSHAALTRWIADERVRARCAAFGPWVFAEFTLVGFAKAYLLHGMPWFAQAAVHMALALLLLLIFEIGARSLLAWHQGPWRTGRRPSLAGAFLIAACLSSAYVSDLSSRPVDDKPDVIVILLDVLRADHLGVYGYERATSPQIDEFATDAIVFENAISQSSFTKTSISSLFSSLYPHRHGVYVGSKTDTAANITSDVLPDELTTLAEALGTRGYLTAAWVDNSQLRAYMGFAQGFDLYRDQPGSMERIASEFSHWMGTWGHRRRFLAYLHVLDLHGPYTPEPPFDAMFGHYSDSFDDLNGPQWRAYRRAVANGEIIPAPDEVEQLKSLYDGQIAQIDSTLGKVFDGLKREGLYDDALIVVTGDHGDAFMEHGFLAHSNTPYEELIRVPLIVKLPRAEHAGLRVAESVALVDLTPTLLDVVGAPPLADVDGLSLLERVTHGTNLPTDRPIVSEYADCIAIRTHPWKYLACDDDEPALFHLEDDPGETADVIALHPEIARPLSERAEVARSLRETPGERVIVDPKTVEALKKLGYL